jgi:hypothetical protein
MKHIKLFENFVFEALGGLVTSKYDLDDFLDAMDKSVNDIYSSGNTRGRKAIFHLSKDGNFNNLTKENIIKCIILFGNDKYGEYDGVYSASYYTNEYDIIWINLPIEKSTYNKISLDYVFIHEFSHAIDPSQHIPLYRYNPEIVGSHRRSDRIARKNGHENFASMKRDEKANELTVGKAYISDETEREAYPDGIAYLVRGLLSKNPGKKEALKDLIRMKDWHIEKVFPELDVLMASLKNLYDYSQYYRDKLIRRISELVINDLPTNLKKIAFITSYDKLSSITIKLLDPNDFKEIVTTKRLSYEMFPNHEVKSGGILEYHTNFKKMEGNGLKIKTNCFYPLFKILTIAYDPKSSFNNRKEMERLEKWIGICFIDSVGIKVNYSNYQEEIIVGIIKNDEHDLLNKEYIKLESNTAIQTKYKSDFPLGVSNNIITNLTDDHYISAEGNKPMYKILSVEE